MSYLFVYGSLLSGISKAKIAVQLQGASELMGTIWLPGKLYDLGYYPGFVYDPASSRAVFGEVRRSTDPDSILPLLDAYEGIHPDRPSENEYIRSVIQTTFQQQPLRLYAYLYNQNTNGLMEIIGGDYRAFVKTNPKHQAFLRSV